MSSYFGTSPQPPPLSLLIPPNPAFGSSEASPKGGILINAQRSPDLSSDSFGESSKRHSKEGTFFGFNLPSPSSSSGQSANGKDHSRTGSTASGKSLSVRRTSEPTSPSRPNVILLPGSPNDEVHPSSILGHKPPVSPIGGPPSLNPPKIRFAPLPDPHRPRSLSTGRNVVTRSSLSGSNGDRTMAYELKDVPSEGFAGEDDDDMAIGDEDLDEEDEEGEMRGGRSWSKTMTMGMGMGMGMGSWKGTKMLLTGKAPVKREVVNVGLSGGAPLTKSVSTTSGFIGSGAHQWSSTQKRRESLLGTSPAVGALLGSRRQSANSVPSAPSHRRNSSLEPSSPNAALGTSPGPVKMLNGRVYGSRRQSEAAQREKAAREKEEPAFVEWGHGKAGGGLGSNAPRSTGGGFLADDDDGGGMSWVKRRREEREKKEREAKERAELESANVGLSSSQSSTEVRDNTILTPNLKITEIPPTPSIQISSPVQTPSTAVLPTENSIENEKGVQAINIVLTTQSGGRGVDIFGDGSEDNSGSQGRIRRRSNSEGEDEEEESESEDEDEEEDDSDFEEDPEDLVEEERLTEAARSTSSAAGVEVVSRHQD